MKKLAQALIFLLCEKKRKIWRRRRGGGDSAFLESVIRQMVNNKKEEGKKTRVFFFCFVSMMNEKRGRGTKRRVATLGCTLFWDVYGGPGSLPIGRRETGTGRTDLWSASGTRQRRRRRRRRFSCLRFYGDTFFSFLLPRG